VAIALSVVAGTTSVVAQPAPGPRYGHEMVFDGARGITVLFGGFGSDGKPIGDTWAWDGEAWELLSDAGPSPRKWPAATYDSRRQVVVLFGGREGIGRSGASLADTWIWDGTQWRDSGATGPSGRDHHRLVYDKRRDRVVLFGGWDGERVIGDTWEWDGQQWYPVSSNGPEPRAPFGMIYHEALDQVVLMGGKDLEQTFSDTWTWSGSEWIKLEVEGPGARSFHSMTYDADGRRAIVYGGRHDDLLLQDLWSWDGGNWELLASAGPLRRGIHASAYDRLRKNLVIHGSGDRVDGTWVLEASTWTWNEPTGWVDVLTAPIVTLRLAGKLEEARTAAESQLLAPYPGPRTEIALRLELARIHDRIGLHTNTRPVQAALKEIERADSLAANLDPAARGAVAASYAYYYYRAEAAERLFPRSTEYVEFAITLLREGNDVRKLSDAVHLLGLIHMQRRELDRARELFDESLALDQSAGVRKWFLGEYHRHVAFVYALADDWEAALPHFEKSLQFRKEAGAIDASLFAAISLGTALIRTGRPAEAQPHLHYAATIADEIASPVGSARALMALGEMHERLNNLKEARISYEAARDAAALVKYTSLEVRAEAALQSLDR